MNSLFSKGVIISSDNFIDNCPAFLLVSFSKKIKEFVEGFDSILSIIPVEVS